MIKNLTRNKLISPNSSNISGIGKTIGLLGKKKAEPVVFNTRFGIHTFFLKFPIDVLIVDKNKKIVFLKKDLKPNRVLFWNIKFNTVIELPSGSIDKSETRNGDSIQISS